MAETHLEPTLKNLTDTILDQRVELARTITEKQNKRYERLEAFADDLLEFRIELVTLYGEALSMSKDEREERIESWGTKTGRACAEMGISLDSMLKEVPEYRAAIGEIIKETAITYDYPISKLYEVLTVLDRTVDDVVYYFCLPFVEVQTASLQASQEQMLEMSVPVVPIDAGVAVLPLVGTIDTHRAKLIMEESLTKCLDLNVSEFVIDLSGVAMVDTFVAHKLFQVIDSLKLIGVKPKISGISPEMAQTIVQLGLNFSDVPSYATLKSALKEIGFEQRLS
ncbi:STAS domain-containing protein [Jeotgalibacillus haloalkalitolerans]|uniref:STAS domain-containing protein n=1 Tax=Jeotgalibacillus haloalkalitolerans TaxID=3104292 RepID=A0ABU5KJG8_9BACL|nr:STAS domain-containing protein [Jeotgalibacillus sp. HH7-29]MDZ5711284.1 STAS domain-containing protein [Jeotgalibacillus sp. HH7-29]